MVLQIACETEFVEKMRAAREREQRRKRQQSAGVPPELQDLMGDSPQEQLQCNESPSAYLLSPSPAKAKIDEQRRHSKAPTPTHDQISPSSLPVAKRSEHRHHHPQPRSIPPQQQWAPERSLSTPPAQSRQAPLLPSTGELPVTTPPAQLRRAQPPPTGELLKQQRQSSLQLKQNQPSRQQAAGHAGGATAGGGGAARKASMLMKSASTRGAGSGSRTTSSSGSGESPARSTSSGRRGREGEGPPTGEVAGLRRKASFFQDWDANEGLRASLSHVWKKAVKKFDLARQQCPQ